MASNSRGEDVNDSDDGGDGLIETVYPGAVYVDPDLPESDEERLTAEDEEFMRENDGRQAGHAAQDAQAADDGSYYNAQ